MNEAEEVEVLETYETHIIAQQPPATFFILSPKELYSVTLVLSQVCVNSRRDFNAFFTIEYQGTKYILLGSKGKIWPRFQPLM